MKFWHSKQYLIRSEHSEQCPDCKSHTLQHCSGFKVFTVGPLPIFAYKLKKVAICAKCRIKLAGDRTLAPKLNKQVLLSKYFGAFAIGIASILVISRI